MLEERIIGTSTIREQEVKPITVTEVRPHSCPRTHSANTQTSFCGRINMSEFGLAAVTSVRPLKL